MHPCHLEKFSCPDWFFTELSDRTGIMKFFSPSPAVLLGAGRGGREKSGGDSDVAPMQQLGYRFLRLELELEVSEESKIGWLIEGRSG